MSTETPNPPAFPTLYRLNGECADESVCPTHYTSEMAEGMSLRDYFAAKALAAGLHPDFLSHQFTEVDIALWIQNAAALSYRLADAMLAERAK